jgi:PIN domain nuclease of toxin-antitoxin system
VRVLLDTHVFLWANVDPARLGATRSLLEDPGTERVVSAASSWEIAIKVGLGRLQVPEPVATWVPSRIHAIAGEALPISHAHVLGVASLPTLHRDPFDRLLVAQAQALGIPIVTADEAIAAYDVEVIRVP